MNLRITDPGALVSALDTLLRGAAEPVHADGSWTVRRVGRALFYHGPTPAGTLEVGGPYPDLRALVVDAGLRVAAAPESASDGAPVWEVRAWADGFYLLRAGDGGAPTRHATLTDALVPTGHPPAPDAS